MIELPNKKYNIIYADPAWTYNDKRSGSGYKNPNGAGGADKHYLTMSLEDICALPVKDIADKVVQLKPKRKKNVKKTKKKN